MFQRQTHSRQMFQLMFQYHANKQIKRRKINDKKVKNTVRLLTQFGATSPTSGGYQARKEVH